MEEDKKSKYDWLTALKELQETLRQKRREIMNRINDDEYECSARERERLLKLVSQLMQIEAEAKKREMRLRE